MVAGTSAGRRRSYKNISTSWDHFDIPINNNTELPRIKKFECLLTYVTSWSIEGIRLAEQNYDIATKKPMDCFGH